MDPFASLVGQLDDSLGLVGAVVAATALARVLLLPAMLRQRRAMRIEERIAEQVVAVRDRYGTDQRAANDEVMAIYRQARLWPFAPLLWLAPQLLVLVACFLSVQRGGVDDLAAPDGLDGWAVSMPVGVWAIAALALISAVYVALQVRAQRDHSGARGGALALALLLAATCVVAAVGSSITAVYLAAAAGVSLLAQLLLARLDPL